MRALPVTKIRQRFDRARFDDPCSALRSQLPALDTMIRPGARIAIAAGSRGIDNLALVVREISDYLKARGAQPFVVPAMGSHGGATAEGQSEILNGYGISEETIGAPIRSSMESIELPRGELSFRVFMDRHAHDADGIILVNRIKPHTDFHGRYESGLMKMALIGLGKLEGARAVHDFGIYGLRELIGPGATQVLSTGKILAGVGLVENAFHETLHVELLMASAIAREEPRLLALAKRHMPRLPVDVVDVLVIDRMGKDISGVGIDPNITGRIGVAGEHDASAPRVSAMMVCALTPETHGNAIGVGLADVITRRLFAGIDYAATYGNVITSSFLERGKIPVVAETDRDAFDIAVRSCGHLPPGRERIVRILDTLHLEEVYVSSVIVEEISNRDHIEIIGPESALFDEAGRLTAF
ncbi:MAG TPA: hypothetical protein VM115_10245 [Vicinamibacterales bacterium]|nr:hypothetical protein [Vicinamibacterales bacterium]